MLSMNNVKFLQTYTTKTKNCTKSKLQIWSLLSGEIGNFLSEDKTSKEILKYNTHTFGQLHRIGTNLYRFWNSTFWVKGNANKREVCNIKILNQTELWINLNNATIGWAS